MGGCVEGVNAGVVAFEQGVHGCRAEGPGEEVALTELAAKLTQGGQLLGCLDPSATISRPRVWPRVTIARAKAESSALPATPLTKERSILRMSTGNAAVAQG